MKKILKCQQSKPTSKKGCPGRSRKGLTLIEILVAISLSLLIVGALYGVYITSYKSYRRSVNRAELNQNVRISLERLSRDLRQTNGIVTTFPASEIKFQDGHDITRVSYITYYRDNENNLKRKVTHYCSQFPAELGCFQIPYDPSTFVRWNELDSQRQLPTEVAEPGKDVIKAQKITDFSLESNGTVLISITAADDDSQVSAQTEVLGRNVQ